MKTFINSTKNPIIKKYSKLIQKKYRDEYNLFIVEGPHLVQEAINEKIVVDIFTTNEKYDGTLVSENILAKLSSTKTNCQIIAICKKIKPQEIGNKVLALIDLQDPGNVGTLIRSAKSFDFDTVLVQGVDIYNPKVIRSTQGALFHTNVIQIENIEKYMRNFLTIGAILDKESTILKDVEKPSKPFMLLLGNEGNGLDKKIIDLLNIKVYIPINFESLNVASAGAILLYHFQ